MDILSFVLGAGTIFGGGGTLAYVRELRKAAKHQSLQESQDTKIKVAIHEALEPLKDDIRTLNTKIEPLWKALEQLAVANAHVLHQPNPARAHIDDLLEKFEADTLTPDEELDLRRNLNIIKRWEPGMEVGFPVLPSEPSAAAAVLSMMEIVRIRRKQLAVT